MANFTVATDNAGRIENVLFGRPDGETGWEDDAPSEGDTFALDDSIYECVSVKGTVIKATRKGPRNCDKCGHSLMLEDSHI